MTQPHSLIEALSLAQLAAYNRADVEAFCACYHEHIEVLDHTGAVNLQGMAAFRARYTQMFAEHTDVTATVDARMVLGPHSVERERWSRVHGATGVQSGGTVIVRYTELEGLIRYAEFLRAE